MSAPIHTLEDLDRAAEIGMARLYPRRLKILVGSASCGIAAGARDVEAAAIENVQRLGLDAEVSRTGCIGFLANRTPPHREDGGTMPCSCFSMIWRPECRRFVTSGYEISDSNALPR